MSAPDITIPIKNALLANSTLTSQLPTYAGSRTIFTRRPVPNAASYPMIVISKDINIIDEDGVFDWRPVITRDIAVYHTNENDANYALAASLAFTIRGMFHRQRNAITVTGWGVTDIRATGPIDVRIDQDNLTGSVVQLAVRVAQIRT